MKRLVCQHIIASNLPDTQMSNQQGCVFGFEPSSSQSQEFGNLYVVAQFNQELGDKQAKTFEKIAGQSFFEPGIKVPLHQRFSNLLKNYNQFLTENKIENPDMFVCCVHNGTLSYSAIGKPFGLLHRKSRFISLVNDATDKNNRFSDITEAPIATDDRILMCSHAVHIQFTTHELKTILQDAPSQNFAAAINERFKNADSFFAAVLIDIEQKLNVFGGLRKKPAKSTKKPSEEPRPEKVINNVNSTTKNIKKKVVPQVTQKTKQGWTSLWSKYINPYPKRAIIILICVAVLIIAIVTISITVSQASNSNATKFQQAQDLTKQAQANLKKQNNSAAESEATKAQQILNGFSTTQQHELNQAASNNPKLTSFNNLQAQVLSVLDEIHNTSRISLEGGYSLGNLTLNALLLINSNLYGVDARGNQIVAINPLRKTPTQAIQSNDLGQTTSTAPAFDGGSSYILSGDKVFNFTPPNKLEQLKVSGLPTSVAISSYLNNLYFLSPQQNQVIRYAKSGTTLSSKTELLKNISSSTLSQATSMAVLGNIFISSGQNILVFEQGNQRDFKINGLPSDFGNIAQLSFNDKGQYFLVLNSTKTRLALLSSGSDSADFKRQYAFGNNNATIQSYVLSPDTNEAFVAVGGKLVSVDLNQQ